MPPDFWYDPPSPQTLYQIARRKDLDPATRADVLAEALRLEQEMQALIDASRRRAA